MFKNSLVLLALFVSSTSIASQCDEIVCTNSSDIGSIGVIVSVGDYSGLLEKLGVRFVSIHEGEFKDGLINGRGRYRWTNGDVYDGEWRNEEPNGIGSLKIYNTDEMVTGNWKNGCLEQGDRMLFTHTEVPPADEGKGIASRLMKEALSDARRRGFKIVPVCSFVVAYVRRHPEFADT